MNFTDGAITVKVNYTAPTYSAFRLECEFKYTSGDYRYANQRNVLPTVQLIMPTIIPLPQSTAPRSPTPTSCLSATK